METYTNPSQAKRDAARKYVKRIKGFYIHALVFILVNSLHIVSEIFENWTNVYDADTYSTLLFWGIGLTVHAISVFGQNLILGKDWEERKIRELMNK